MKIIAKRIISYLKLDSTLTNLLGSSNNIFIDNSVLRKPKYVTISTRVGEDQNNIPADIGMLDVTAVSSRKEANAHKVCLDIAERLDILLNKQELSITNTNYKIINFVRKDSTGLQIDNDSDEFFYRLEFSYIIDESS